MSAADCVLAILLLTAPPESTLCRGLAPLYPTLRPTLLTVAVAMELVDARELASAAHFIGDGPTWASELTELQARHRALRCAPCIAECQRFPPKQFIDEWLATNRAYKTSLQARMAVDQIHADELRRAVEETETLHRIWSVLRDAQYECYYTTVRRRSLMELRELLGLEAYCRALMPPHLPIWHIPAWR
jgi:hypothetical protein